MDRGQLVGPSLRGLPKGNLEQSLGLLSMGAPSPVGDVAGLLADGIRYAKDPKSLTVGSGLLSLLGLAPGIPNAAMFLGPLAKTADLKALERAKELVKAGADDARIWKETGWWVRTHDGVPRFEAPDNIDTFRTAYPDSGVSFEPHSGPGGNYNEWTKTVSYGDETGALAHETSHAVQDLEGMSKGGYSPLAISKKDIDAVKADLSAQDVQEKIAEKFELFGSTKLTERDFEDLAKARSYLRKGGEAEARAVVRRLNFTDEMRKSTPPWESFDVPIGLLRW